MSEQHAKHDANQDIQSTLKEKRLFDPPSEFSAKAHIGSIAEYERLCGEADRDPEAFWEQSRGNSTGSSLGRRYSNGTRPGRSGLSEANSTWRTTASTVISPRGAEQGRDYLGRRAGRRPHAHLPATAFGGVEVRQRAEVARREEGRPGGDLHGHGARTRHRVAGLRAHRCASYSGVRRLLVAGARRPNQRLSGSLRGDAGRLVASRH